MGLAGFLGAVSLGAASGGCDQGHQDDQPTVGTTPLKLVGMNIGPSQSIPANGSVELAFDRFLDPSTVNRQGVTLAAADGTVVAFAKPLYDPVLRKVTLQPVDSLTAGQPYTVSLAQWPSGVDSGGLRATDGAPLAAAITLGFMATEEVTLPPPPKVTFCGDILPVFQRSCSSSNCHGAPTPGGDPTRTGTGSSYPAEGLALSTGPWVQTSAIDGMRPAIGDNTGPSGVASTGIPGLFGVDMPLVSPGNAGNSWLLYKCLISPVGAAVAGAGTGTGDDAGGAGDGDAAAQLDARAGDAGTADAALADGAVADGGGDGGGAAADAAAGDAGVTAADTGDACAPTAVTYSATASTAASDAERARLADQIQGNVMPYPFYNADGSESLAGSQPLTLDELERLSIWIQEGAPAPDCAVTCQ